MTPAARISAAIEVLEDLIQRRRPAADALKDWGLARRFAGSKDRAAVASLVYDALRRRASSAFAMGDETPRGLVLGMLASLRGLGLEEIAGLCTGEHHAPAPLSEAEIDALAQFSVATAPDWVKADVPEWLWPSLAAAFGQSAVSEGQALAARAPIDIRANRLKTSRDQLLRELEHLGPEPGAWSPDALRFQPGHDGRGPSLQTEPSFFSGGFEIQDEGSQLVTLLAGAQPGQLVVDLCAGAGGKTLALAAIMGNQGRIYATDLDSRRLAPLHERLARSGATLVEIRIPRSRGHEPLEEIKGQADCVLVDMRLRCGKRLWRRAYGRTRHRYHQAGVPARTRHARRASHHAQCATGARSGAPDQSQRAVRRLKLVCNSVSGCPERTSPRFLISINIRLPRHRQSCRMECRWERRDGQECAT